MSLIHEPRYTMIYVIHKKYAKLIYRILEDYRIKKKKINELNGYLEIEQQEVIMENFDGEYDPLSGIELQEVMMENFDGEYYPLLNSNGEYAGCSCETIEKYQLNNNGELEIYLCNNIPLDMQFPLFLMWKFADIKIKVHSDECSDSWWWSCYDRTVRTNDPEDLKARGWHDRNTYYAELVNRIMENHSNEIKQENGIYLINSTYLFGEQEGEDNEWLPLESVYRFTEERIELVRPVEPPVNIRDFLHSEIVKKLEQIEQTEPVERVFPTWIESILQHSAYLPLYEEERVALILYCRMEKLREVNEELARYYEQILKSLPQSLSMCNLYYEEMRSIREDNFDDNIEKYKFLLAALPNVLSQKLEEGVKAEKKRWEEWRNLSEQDRWPF